ncbi:MAG: TatD family hydrolase [Chitinophagaceae bacterium]|nr:TatD family hydrolase [Chitinophagaceae bacterium]
MKLIDTHSHIYLEEFKADIDSVIERARKAGVEKIFLPAIDSRETDHLLDLEKKFPGVCVAMTGLHPCSVKAGYRTELDLVNRALGERVYAAVGEIGLDFHWDKTYITEQYEAFEIQIGWALEHDLPIVIHSRDAMQECIDVVRRSSSKGVKGIFHCFGGSYEQARQIIDLGMYLGIGGVVTYKNSGLAEVLDRIDLQHLVLETDAPYLTPVPYRGKRNECAYLAIIAEKLAQIKKTSLDEVAAITSANAEKIFGN